MPYPEGMPLGELEEELWQHAVSSMDAIASPVTLLVDQMPISMAALYRAIAWNRDRRYITDKDADRAMRFFERLMSADDRMAQISRLPYEKIITTDSGLLTLPVTAEADRNG